MVLVRALPACVVFGMVAINPAHAAPPCKEPELGGRQAAMLSPPVANVVTGAGRLQFYSAPNLACAMNGTFVIARDQLIAYGETDDGWSSVMYTNPRTGDAVSGWVRSARLKQTGTVGPKQ